MKKNSKTNETPATFKEMVETRKFEMQSILPGFYTVVKDPYGKHAEEKVYSPDIMHRSLFKIGAE